MSHEEKLKFISIEDRNYYGACMLYVGVALGAIGMLFIGFVSLYVLGAFVP